jgi:hypothetical protein
MLVPSLGAGGGLYLQYQLVNTTTLFSDEVDPVGVLAECWALVRELVEGYIWQYQFVNTAILFSEEVDPVGVLAEYWALVQELVEGYIWQYQPFVILPSCLVRRWIL